MTLRKNNTSYHIYIDFDDVLCETAKLLLQVANKEFGRNILFQNIHSFNIGETFELTEQEVRHVLNIMHKPENLLAIPPIESAACTINNWAKQGCKIDIVTGRPPFSEESSRAWLDKYNISYSNIIFVNKYEKNNNGFDHHDTALTLNELKNRHYDLAIDDSATMLEFLFTEMKMDIAVFHRPWNAKLEIPTNTNPARKIKRCHSWNDIKTQFGKK